MNYTIKYTTAALKQLGEIRSEKGLEKRYKAVKKAISYLEINPRHPGLNTHRFYSMSGPRNEKVYVAYAENETPAAYRVFFYYIVGQNIVIVAITDHPEG